MDCQTERERERERKLNIILCVCVCMYLKILSVTKPMIDSQGKCSFLGFLIQKNVCQLSSGEACANTFRKCPFGTGSRNLTKNYSNLIVQDLLFLEKERYLFISPMAIFAFSLIIKVFYF